VVLSLWKVDDVATALLMDRFYANLLGQVEGLEKPLPKAEALSEAKRWLRELPAREATTLAANLTAGIDRGKGRVQRPGTATAPTKPAELPKGERPFEHPFYWSAFILIGDPD
jgi:CHAT domain-containing protein